MLKYKPWYVKVKWYEKKNDWFYLEGLSETVCICDWVFGWGVVISFVEGHPLWEKWDPISARNEGGARTPKCKGTLLRRATPPLKVSFWSNLCSEVGLPRVLVLRGRLHAGSLVFLLDLHTHRRTHHSGWFWLTGCQHTARLVSTTADNPH